MVKIEKGIKNENNGNYYQFGKFIIQMTLLDDNILLVKYKSYAPIPSIKRKSISDDLRDIIINIFDTGEINYQLGKTLTNDEKDTLNNLIVKAGLKKQLNFNYKNLIENIKDVINDFNILKGIIIAGNDNPEVIQQLKEVLDKLIYYKKITPNEAKEILEEISD